MKYYSFDPGAGRSDTIGRAKFDDYGCLMEMGQCTFDELVVYLEKQDPEEGDVCIYERYIIKPHKLTSHKGSRVETVQTIGAIKSWAIRNKLEIVEQPDSILAVAQLWFDLKMPSNHSISHQISATLHGMYYLKMQGKIMTALEADYARRKAL